MYVCACAVVCVMWGGGVYENARAIYNMIYNKIAFQSKS